MNNMKHAPSGADMLARSLAAHGVKRAYGIPGGEVLAIIEAFGRAGIDFHLVKHENAGGFMAEGAWHADGHPPVLVATVGPGVANGVNVVANAIQDRVPLLFITGSVERGEAERYTHQVFDHANLLREITKAQFLGTPQSCGLIGEKAVATALEPQMGPVLIDLPVSVAEGIANEAFEANPLGNFNMHPGHDETLKKAAAALGKAKNPIAIAGVDAVNENAGPAIEAFCRKHAIPLLAAYKAKGLIDEADPLSLGGAGLSPKADRILMPLLEEADCVLLLGYDPIEMRIGWRDPWTSNKTVIEITPVLRTHGMHHVSQTLRGNIAPTLAVLEETIKARDTNLAPQAQQAREALKAAFVVSSEEFGPDTVFNTLRDCLPDDTVATADSGAHRILLSQMWECRSPRGLLQSTALCTMACAVPLAAGYKHAAPQTPVIAFVGDAGLEMGLGELATLREHHLPILICVLVDESLALIEMKQRGSQRPNSGVDFTSSNFPAIAKAMGGHGVWIDDADTLRLEAQEALSRDSFTLLACRIGRKAYDGKF